MLKRLARNYSTSVPIVSYNPATGKALKTFEFAGRKEIDNTLEASHKAYNMYKKSSFAERAKLLENVAAKLMQNKEEYGKIITTEMGKPINAAISEVEKCASLCTYYAQNAEQQLADETIKTDGATLAKVIYQPMGPILQGAPFNFPFWQVIRFAAPAIMAGNTVLIRHSHSVPQSAEKLEQLFVESGYADHVYKNVFVDNAAVSRMIQDFRVRGVTFTGSTQTGRIFAEQAGRNIKKHVLELGGNDAFIVLADADMEMAVSTAVSCRMLNNGQSCISSKRFIVEESIKQEFTDRMVAEFKKLKVGDPMDPSVGVGPLARKDLRDKLAAQVNMSVSQGAKVLYGGFVPAGDGFFYQPTILSDVKPGMVAEEEELFGPVATIIGAKNEEEAVEIANHSEYGLGGAVMTRDTVKGERVARALESGMAFVNTMSRSAVNLPFGGVKNSGYGRECGKHGIQEWTNVKTLFIK